MNLKKVKLYYSPFAFIAGLLFLISCSDKEVAPTPPTDGAKPTITWIAPDKTEITVAAGTPLPLRISFKDDVALGSVKIEIHHNFYGNSDNAFVYNKTIDSGLGTSYNYKDTITIPATVASGPYHIEISCWDKAGNAAETFEKHLFVSTTSSPVISNFIFNGQYINSEFEMSFPDTVESLKRPISAILKDLDGLDSLKYILVEAEEHSGKRAHEEPPVWKIEKALIDSTDYSLIDTLIFQKSPLDNLQHYELFINVRDKKGNYSSQVVKFYIKK